MARGLLGGLGALGGGAGLLYSGEAESAPRLTVHGLRALLEEDPRTLSAIPDVPQVNLLRRWPKKEPASIAALAETGNWERVKKLAEQGVEEGGLAWYNANPLRQAAIDKLGEAEGNAWFNGFMDHVAATSPRATVAENIRRASYFWTRAQQGHPPPVLEQPPAPYGHLAHRTHAPMLAQLQEGQPFNPVTQPKAASFSENLKGNWAPYTVDTHNARAWGLKGTGAGVERGPTLTEYPFLEQLGVQQAAEMGIAPAQHQASLWMGAAAETGVRDKGIFMRTFNDVLARTAKARGVTPKKALDDFIRGKAPLLGTGGAGILLGAGLAPADEAEAATEAREGILAETPVARFERGLRGLLAHHPRSAPEWATIGNLVPLAAYAAPVAGDVAGIAELAAMARDSEPHPWWQWALAGASAVPFVP